MRTAARLLWVVLALAAIVAWAPRSWAQATKPAVYRVLIGFAPVAELQAAQDRADVVEQAGGVVHVAFRLVPVVSAWVSPEAVSTLAGRPDVAYVEEDVVLQAFEQSTPWGVHRIAADLVWPGGNTGAGVDVAILDTGIDGRHPDLAVVDGVNFAGPPEKDGSTNPADWNDNYGHGTHCAGIVAALNNGVGVVGVAPGARLHAVKVLDDTGLGSTSDIIQGLEWCVTNHIRVASLSLGGSGTVSLQEACDKAFAAGVLIVAAAGNTGGAVRFPAGYPSVVAVSATDSRDQLASFSSFGPEIALAAPGVDIYSTYKGGSYAQMSGTSMACPHVAGAAALVWAAGAASNSAVRDTLTGAAQDLGPAGQDPSFGYGLVDARKAAGVGTSTVQITNPADGATVSGTVTVEATTGGSNGITGVEFFVDTTSIGSGRQGTGGWSIAWDTTRFHDSTYELVAVAVDSLRQTASHSIKVVVNNTQKTPKSKTMHISAIEMSAAKANQGYLIHTKVTIVDDSSPVPQAVSGAKVSVTTTRPNGRAVSGSAVTGADGAAVFSIASAVSGTFVSTVTGVSDSLVYDPSANRETTKTYVVK